MMKYAKSVVAIMLVAALAAPTVHAKKNKALALTPASTTLSNSAASNANPNSQAGGLPATNERVTALEAAVVTLRADLTAEIAARIAADTTLTNALNAEIAARKAADDALAAQLDTIPTVFVADGSATSIKASTVTVASRTVPAGTYFLLAAVQMTNSQTTGDANARCVMRANGNLLADTSDLEFPILTAAAGAANPALGSTLFAPLQGSYSSTSPIAILVECTESNGDNGGLDAYVHIAAMKAGTVE